MNNEIIRKGRFQQKCDTTANWEKTYGNFTPKKGEIIIYQDYDDNGKPLSPKYKSGDGETDIGELSFSSGGIEPGEGKNSIQQTGTGAISIGEGATAFGKNTTAYGPMSFIEGASYTTAQASLDLYNNTNGTSYQLQDITTDNLHLFWGNKKDWNKNFSLARTLPTTDTIDGVALEGGAHVEGLLNVGIGSGVHAEGYHTWCLANAAHTEGYGTKALADGAHAEGGSTTAKKAMAHAEGQNSISDGVAAHAEGYSSALENFAHSEGYLTYAKGKHSHVEGWGTIATADDSHVQGKFNIEDTAKRYAHIQGAGTQAAPKNIHTIDWDGNAWFIGQIKIGGSSYDNGQVVATQAHVTTSINSAISGLTIKKGTGGSSLALNMGTCLAGGYASVALGHNAETTAAHAIALGQDAHAYAANATAIGASEASAQHAFAVGYSAQATSKHAIALGYSAKAKQEFACAIGHGATASGKYSFAQGNVATASGEASVAFGEQTKATAKWQMAIGAFNQTDADALFIVGNGTGTSDSQRSNAFVVKKDGTGYLGDKKILVDGSNTQSSLEIRGECKPDSEYAHPDDYFPGRILLTTKDNDHTLDAYLNGGEYLGGLYLQGGGKASHGGPESYILISDSIGTYTRLEDGELVLHNEYDLTSTILYSATQSGLAFLAEKEVWSAEGDSKVQVGYSKIYHEGRAEFRDAQNDITSIDGGTVTAANYVTASAGITEMYEWTDGNANDEDRRGLFITLDGGKIRVANENDSYILGVIDPNPSLIGDAAGLEWKDKYLKDVFGSYIYEEVEVPAKLDEDGNVLRETHTRTQKVLNPEYDETQEYISRTDRKEFAAITSKGKVVMIDDGTCIVNGYATVGVNGQATYSSDNYAIRVLERIDETHIKVLIDSIFVK